MELMISKIGGVKVIQSGDSTLEVKHKSEDGGKVGGYGQDGSNQTIDLGKGKKINKIHVTVSGQAENISIYNILYFERFTTVTDKFRGTLNVYIDDFKITDSDKHTGVSKYEVTFTEQDEGGSIEPNFGIILFDFAKLVNINIVSDIESIVRLISDTTVNPITNMFSNVLSQQFFDGINTILSDIKIIGDPIFDNIEKSRIRSFFKSELLNNSLDETELIRFINSTVNLRKPETAEDLDMFVKTYYNDNDTYKRKIRGQRSMRGDTVNQHLRKTEYVNINEASDIFRPKVYGLTISEEASSQYENDEQYINSLKIATGLNRIKIERSLKSIVLGGFNSREDFELEVNDIISRAKYAGLSTDEISDIIFSVRSYANKQRYRNIIEIDIEDPKPLTKILYDLYHNLDDYETLRIMNNFADNDRIIGKVKVFEVVK